MRGGRNRFTSVCDATSKEVSRGEEEEKEEEEGNGVAYFSCFWSSENHCNSGLDVRRTPSADSIPVGVERSRDDATSLRNEKY